MKDNKNILDYNLWTGGDYNKNINGINHNNNSTITTTNNYSSFGENSFKITRTSEAYPNTANFQITNLTGTTNIQLSLDVYSPDNNCEIDLYDTKVISSITIPSSNNSSHILLNGVTNSSSFYVRFRLPDKESYMFIDNISLITG